jgi:predicted kinase
MPNATTPTLIAFSGLPGVGKTTIARDLARGLEALHLRVDSIEAALKNSSLRIHPAEDAGYQALIAIARDNLANCLTRIMHHAAHFCTSDAEARATTPIG